MGILDSKTRFIDTIVTNEGRKQLSSGKMRIEFVSFTDADAFYVADIASGSAELSDGIQLEACILPQDQITFEADDSGKLVPYRGSTLGVIDGKILSSSNDSFLTVVTGSTFTSLADQLLDSSLNNFRKLSTIKTNDVFFDDERDFATNVNSVDFTITNTTPFSAGEVQTVSIDQVESLFQDRRLSHLPNFRYLPPMNTSIDGVKTSLGNFPMIGQKRDKLTYEELMTTLKEKESNIIDFTSSSPDNNVVSQFFELKQDLLTKLDVIDFGEFNTNDVEFPVKRVFFVGKVFIDSFGAQTFVNMFTLIFE